MRYAKNLLQALSHTPNTVLGGHPSESLSARAWRLRDEPFWSEARVIIDTLFWFDPDHCRRTLEADLQRAQAFVAKYGMLDVTTS